MSRAKEPLFRKHNKLARGFHHNNLGGEYRHMRNSKEMLDFAGSHMSMGTTSGGYDYTPLFKFLLSRIGDVWDDVFSEAVARLDKQEPIFWLVNTSFREGDPAIVRIGESSYYS